MRGDALCFDSMLSITSVLRKSLRGGRLAGRD
jgi:hypothetical protein